MRNLLRTGESAALVLLMMFVGSLVLWIGMPVGTLYVGSQVESKTDSIGAALAAMMIVVVLALAVLLRLLGWLNHKHMEVRAARGHQDLGQTPLEGVLVVSAGIALVAFGVWFFFLAGTAPFPVSGRGT